MVMSMTTTSTVRNGRDPTEPEPAARLHARVNPPQHNDGFTLHTRTALLTHNDCLTRPDYDRRGYQSDGSYDRRCHWGSDPRATWHASHPTGTAHTQQQRPSEGPRGAATLTLGGSALPRGRRAERGVGPAPPAHRCHISVPGCGVARVRPGLDPAVSGP